MDKACMTCWEYMTIQIHECDMQAKSTKSYLCTLLSYSMNMSNCGYRELTPTVFLAK